jgi:site-specific recombinase XerD
MIAAGVDLATVSALLGHAGVRVMAAVYVHATSRSPADTIGKFER